MFIPIDWVNSSKYFSLEPEIDEKDHKIKTDLDHFEDNYVNGIEDIDENLQHDKIDEEKYKIQTENGFTRESRRR